MKSFLHAALLIFALLSVPTGGIAANKAKKVKAPLPAERVASETPAPLARLRIWKLALKHHAELRLVWKVSKPKGEINLLGGSAGNQFVDDALVPAGAGSLEIYDPASGDSKPYFSLDGTLTGGSSCIALISETIDGKGVQAEWVRIAAQGSNEGELIVYNFVPNLKDCRLSMGSTITVQIVSMGASLRLKGFKRVFSPAVVEGEELSGRPFRWTSEVDFSRIPRAIVLICQDTYGRVRPKLILELDEGPVDTQKKG